jgi:riboflavin kinase/FMN adenylyltransferase
VLVLETIAELQGVDAPVHLAMGVFDGVHIGHQEVISAAVEGARESGGVAAVLTFEPHPIQVLAPEKAPRRISASLAHKERLLEELGVDLLVVHEFTKEFALEEAEDFMAALGYIVADLRQVSVGVDWKFGKDRMGTVAKLEEWGAEENILISSASPVMLEGERVSSTRIRQAIRDGNLASAREMLGRPYSVWGTVVHGRQLGGKIGVPTANIETGKEQLPPDGVYTVSVWLNGAWMPGVGNLGCRPTVGGEQHLLEVHVFGFSGDLYGCAIEVRIEGWIREEKKFESIEALKEQIEKDMAVAAESHRAAE